MKLMGKLMIASSLFAFVAHAQPKLDTDIVDTAVAAGGFGTLVAAVSAADLVGVLKSEGPFTVFAPTDSAFAKLPEGTVPALLNDIPALKNILLYHVVVGGPSAEALLASGGAVTVQGKSVRVSQAGDDTFVNETKVLAEIEVKNGRILVIESVLLP